MKGSYLGSRPDSAWNDFKTCELSQLSDFAQRSFKLTDLTNLKAAMFTTVFVLFRM